VKEDTFAVLKVIDLLGRDIKLYDSGTLEGKTNTYTNFILQAVNEARQEKFQVVETFGDPYIFFYGEAPRFLDCSAILINSQDFNWQTEFWENYDKYLRGSKCAEVGARVYMFYDDKVVEGYMLQAVAVTDAQMPMSVQLSFKLFLTNYRNISMVGDPNFPIRLGVDVQMVQQGNETINPQTGERTVTRLRSLIIDNKDEWTGPQPPLVSTDAEEAEVDDLIRKAVEAAAQNYANMNSVDSIADAGLTNANSGYGTGGKAPSKKPNSTTSTGPGGAISSSDPKNCVGGETTESDGGIYCTDINGNRIRVGTANNPNCPPDQSTPGCPEPPPPSPPGAAPAPPAANPPVNNSSTGDNGSSSTPASSSNGDGTTGGFTSTTIPNCPPDMSAPGCPPPPGTM
jgi:hypothetical protein